MRKAWVPATPEEIVRQKLLGVMIHELGFPRSLIAVEVQLSEVPHLQGIVDLPKRRADLICYAQGIHPEFSLFPLLLVECKEGSIGEEAIQQALGYNHYLQAPFVAVAGIEEAKLVYPQRVAFIPPYSQLLESLCKQPCP